MYVGQLVIFVPNVGNSVTLFRGVNCLNFSDIIL